MTDTPITFDAPSFALLDVELNAVLTTSIGNLAIFSTKVMADQMASTSRRKIKVVPVFIKPATTQ